MQSCPTCVWRNDVGALYVLASEHPSHHRSSRGRFPSAFLPCASSFPLTSLASVECKDLLDGDAVEVAQEADKTLGTFSKDFEVVPDGYGNPLATLLSHHAHQEATAPTHTISRPYGILSAMKRQAYVQRVGYKDQTPARTYDGSRGQGHQGDQAPVLNQIRQCSV